MHANDFLIFCTLLSDVHCKAFGDPLDALPYGKAQALSWLIHDATGDLLSYKSLRNFSLAVLENSPEKVNPNDATLSILARFVQGETGKHWSANTAWYYYRNQVRMAVAS